MRAREDVTIEVPSRSFEVAFPRARRFLRWTRVRVIRRRFVVVGLPLRELLVMHTKIHRLGQELPHLSPAEACVVILGSLDALMLTEDQAREIWESWHELNCLAKPSSSGAPARESASSVLDLVLQLERWPFQFTTERVMQMTALEAISRLQEFERASAAAREAAVA